MYGFGREMPINDIAAFSWQCKIDILELYPLGTFLYSVRCPILAFLVFAVWITTMALSVRTVFPVSEGTERGDTIYRMLRTCIR